MCDVSILIYTFSFQEVILTIHYGYILRLLCLHCMCQDSLSWGSSSDPVNKCCLECKIHALAPHKVWLQIQKEAVKINVNLLCSKKFPYCAFEHCFKSSYIICHSDYLLKSSDLILCMRCVTKIKPLLTSDLFDTLKNQWPLIQASVLAVAPLVSQHHAVSIHP